MKIYLPLIISTFLVSNQFSAQYFSSSYQFESYFTNYAQTPEETNLSSLVWDYNFPDYSLGFYVEAKKIKDKRIEQKLAEIQIIRKNKKGEISYKSNTKYNTLGRITEYNVPSYSKKMTYISDTIPSEFIEISKKKYSKTNYTHDNQLYIARESNKKNEVVSESTTRYNENKKPISQLTRSGKKLENSSEYKSFYNSNGKLEKNQHFTNGILVSEWKYDCGEEGKKVKENEIVQSSSCTWKDERNDGSYTKYYRNIYNGIQYLTKTEFTKDSVAYSINIFLNDTILMSSSEKNGTSEIVKHYNKKGKIMKLNTIISNNEGKQIQFQSTKFGIQKMTSIKTYEYNDKGQMTKSTNCYNERNFTTTIYEYDEKEMLKKYTISKKGKIISTKEIIYTYNQ